MRRRDFIHLLILALAVFATRFTCRAQTLFDWDSVQFALAVSDFDIVAHQPHPPGCIFIVLFLKAGTAVFGDPNLIFIMLNIFAGMGTVILLFFLAKSLWGERAARVACWAYLFCSVFWFHGSVAAAYAIDGFWSLAIGAAAWRAIRRPSSRAVIALAFAYAVGAGFRQNLAAVFLPLFAYAVWRGGRSNFIRALAAGIAALVIAGWFIPTVAAGGGFAAYREASDALYGNIALKTSLFGLKTWNSFFRNVLSYIVGAARSLNLLCVPLMLGMFLAWRRGGIGKNRERTLFFSLYLLPPSLVFCAVHLPKFGYLLAVLPIFFGAAARELLRIEAWLKLRMARFQPGHFILTSVIMLSLFNICLYCLLPSFHGVSREARKSAKPAASNRFGLDGISRRDARNNGIRALGNAFPEESTLILCAYEAARFLRHVSYYLPRHRVIEFNVSSGEYIAFGGAYRQNQPEGAAPGFGKYERANLLAFASRAGEEIDIEKNYCVVPGDKEIEIVSQFHVFRIPLPPAVDRIVLLTTVRRLKRSKYLHRPGTWSVKNLPLPGAEELETCALVFSRGAAHEFSGG